MKTIEELTGTAYTAYCEAVGGRAFNGEPLPNWAEFSADPNKQKQVQAWKKAVEAVVPPAPADYRERVRMEKAELTDKIAKLRAFLDSNKVDSIHAKEEMRMRRQLVFMEGYNTTLQERIDAFTPEVAQ